jgi:hypothetical protein
MAPLINAALVIPADDAPQSAAAALPIQIREVGAAMQPFHEAMTGMKKDAQKLLDLYKKHVRRDTRASRLETITESFKKDKGVTEASVQAGAKVTQKEIENLLTDRFHEVRAGCEITDEEEKMGRLLLDQGATKDAKSKTMGWGNVAMEVEDAVERLCLAGDRMDVRR